MSQESERVYTVNLGKVLLTPNNQRAKRAINMVKEFARRHMKMEQIKIEEELSHLLWSRGIKHPPRKVRVKMTKTDEGYILISKYEGEENQEKKKDEKIKPVPEPVVEPEVVEPEVVEPEVVESEPVEPAAKAKPAAKA
ncbi:MAG: 50S ribosomal protein L31e, partial [Candidatus Nitrosopelagicus sp.]|nr:50S ribosomal protein L31e [Candidatus Nitrosopelagicus sp.]